VVPVVAGSSPVRHPLESPLPKRALGFLGGDSLAVGRGMSMAETSRTTRSACASVLTPERENRPTAVGGG